MSIVAGILVVLGALLALAGSVGLLSMKTFYERVHPPTIGAAADGLRVRNDHTRSRRRDPRPLRCRTGPQQPGTVTAVRRS